MGVTDALQLKEKWRFGRLECPPQEVVDCGVAGRGVVGHGAVGHTL